MDCDDSTSPFLKIPWIARKISQPEVVCFVPGCREPKESTEDSMMAEIFKTPRTIGSCIGFYVEPLDHAWHLDEVSTVITVGNGLNGHPKIMHGGITAALCDEGTGILLSINNERRRLADPNAPIASAFTVQLTIKYLQPVNTPGEVLVAAQSVKREGRKEWLRTEVRQWDQQAQKEVICAIGEAIFIQAKTPKL